MSKSTPILSLLFLLGLSPSAFAQFGGDEPMERYDMPPALFKFHPESSQMIAHYGPFVSYQVNVNGQGNNILGDAANEPSFCIDQTNPSRMAVGWRQFDSVSSNFRQSGYGYTTDGGQHWTFPGKLENNVFRSDPVLGSDTTGQFYYLSLLQSFFDDIWSSTTGGAAWQRIAPATGGDKEWFVIDNTNSSGHGFMYQTWSTAGNNYNGRQFSRSTNGGVTWMNPIDIPNSAIWGTLDVDLNGNLYLGVGGGSGSSAFYCIRSSNAKNGTVTPTFDQTTQDNLGGSMGFSNSINPAGLVGQISIVVDKSGGSTSGNIYMGCSVNRPGTLTSDFMFTRSTDGGTSFSTPHKINDDPTTPNKWHWFGTLGVAPNGRVDAIWYDTRNDPGNLLTQVFYSYSLDGGMTWAPNIQVTPSFNPSIGYPQQNKIGDYIGVISDNTGANVVYSATFNNEEDVYYVHPGPAAVAVSPSSFSLPRGIVISGGLNEMLNSDDQYLILRPGVVLSSTEAPVQLVVSGTSPTATPSAYRFRLEAATNQAGLQQNIGFYNFTTNAYEFVDSRLATTVDSIVIVDATGAASRFVDPTTREIRATVTYRAVQPILSYPWLARIDQVQWSITP